MLQKFCMFWKKKGTKVKYSNDDAYSSVGDFNSTDVMGVGFQQFRKIHGNEAVACVKAAKPGHCLSGAEDTHLVLSSFLTGETVQIWTGHEKGITKVDCRPDVNIYVSTSRDKSVNIWRSDNKLPVHRCTGHQLVVTGVSLNTTGSQMCTGSRDNTVRLWNVGTGECIRKNALLQNVITDVKWSHESDLIAQSGEDKMLHLWDARTLDVAMSTPPKQYIQTCCDVSKCDRFCLSSSNGFAGHGCETTLWDTRAIHRPLVEFLGHFETVAGCCFVSSLAGVSQLNVAATCSSDSTVRLWDCSSGNMLADITLPASGPLTSVAAADSERCLLVSSFKAGLQVLSVCSNADGNIKLRKTAEL